MPISMTFHNCLFWTIYFLQYPYKDVYSESACLLSVSNKEGREEMYHFVEILSSNPLKLRTYCISIYV